MGLLIDVDKTIDIIDNEMTMEDSIYNDGLCRAIQIIGEQPIVKAIPVEWIEKWITYWERILPDWGAFQVCAAMLKDWEKENEISVMPVSDNSTIPLDYLGGRK